jgi:hypothetical protein
MGVVLLVFVFAVLLFAWLAVALIFFAMVTTEIGRLVAHCKISAGYSVPASGQLAASDARFLRDLGIRP